MKAVSSSAPPGREIFAPFAMVARALGHPCRLGLLQLLAQGERSVEALAEQAGLGLANASQHLQQLRRAGLVATRRQGNRIFYRLSDRAVVALLSALRRLAERNLSEVARLVERHFKVLDQAEPIGPVELVQRMKKGLVTLIDVRPAEEFAQGHLPGALNLPLAELGRRARLLPRRRAVVAYCRGPYCMLSYEAVARLRRRGFTALRLEDGVPEWRARGLPVERGAPQALAPERRKGGAAARRLRAANRR